MNQSEKASTLQSCYEGLQANKATMRAFEDRNEAADFAYNRASQSLAHNALNIVALEGGGPCA